MHLFEFFPISGFWMALLSHVSLWKLEKKKLKCLQFDGEFIVIVITIMVSVRLLLLFILWFFFVGNLGYVRSRVIEYCRYRCPIVIPLAIFWKHINVWIPEKLPPYLFFLVSSMLTFYTLCISEVAWFRVGITVSLLYCFDIWRPLCNRHAFCCKYECGACKRLKTDLHLWGYSVELASL